MAVSGLHRGRVYSCQSMMARIAAIVCGVVRQYATPASNSFSSAHRCYDVAASSQILNDLEGKNISWRLAYVMWVHADFRRTHEANRAHPD